MGYRSTGKVLTPPSSSVWVHRHRRCLVFRRWLQGGRGAGFTVVYAVDTGPPHDGASKGRPSNVCCAVRLWCINRVSAAGWGWYRDSAAAESSHAVQAQRTAPSQDSESQVQGFQLAGV